MSNGILNFGQFNLLYLFVLATLVCVAAAWGQYWFAALAVGAVLIVLVCVEALIRNLPTGIVKSIRRNCLRANGTWSEKRALAERKALRKLWQEIGFLVVVLLVPNLFLIWAFDTQVMPISLGWSAVESFDSDPVQWKTNLQDESRALDRWHGESVRPADKTSYRQLLWRWWPLIVGGILTWIFVCCLAFQKFYFALLKDLSLGVAARFEAYQIYDLHHPHVEATSDLELQNA